MDLRLPIGGLFVVLGVILAVHGAITNTDTAMYARATGVNINLWWGVILIAFGALFLVLAMRRRTR